MADENVDYLDIDSPINGQNYCCLSFVSPESVIEDRHAFNVSKFLQSICKSQDMEFDKVMSQYQDFTYKHEDALQKEFDERNNFKTSVRGVKIRGVYQSRQEAELRASKLHKSDSNFHVFVGQVGYWLPWDPSADKIEDETFADTQLNELMTKYKENNVNKDIFYEEQKRDKIKAAQEERLRADKERKAKEALDNVSDEPCPEGPIPEDEPCPEEPSVQSCADKVSEDEPCSVVSDEPAPGGASDLERALNDEDPWMAQKNKTA
uniref:Uncharacterized protein n=1 Tax=viral metagenome TaxID=1070528 RepID=A0A6C0C581_9ZZZZ